MDKYIIGNFLKQLRKEAGCSVKNTIIQLESYDIYIAEKTLYGYENSSTIPNAEIFLALCKIYHCENPMSPLGRLPISSKEYTIIRKYRLLDTIGKEIVDSLLDAEVRRSIQIQKLKQKSL